MLQSALYLTLLLRTLDAPQFDAAAIHPADPRGLNGASGCPTDPVMLRCFNVTLKRCITGAYGIGADRVLGGPAWMDTDRFQITAHAAQPKDDKGMMAMLQTLLAQRFHLQLHRETRPHLALVLSVAESGSKLQPSSDADLHFWKNPRDHFEAAKITISEFSEILSRELNLPVLDRTELSGAFNIHLDWNRNDANIDDRDEAAAIRRADTARAIERQLGLTVKFQKMPVEVLVVDHAEKPSVADN